MVGNGTISYDHERDGRPTELGGCNAMVRNLKHDAFLFIRYIRRRLTVSDVLALHSLALRPLRCGLQNQTEPLRN